jgi:hypothetical protein
MTAEEKDSRKARARASLAEAHRELVKAIEKGDWYSAKMVSGRLAKHFSAMLDEEIAFRQTQPLAEE